MNRDSVTATANPFIIKVHDPLQQQQQQPRHQSIDPFDFQSEASNESYEDNISAPYRPVQSGRASSSRRSKAYSRDTTKLGSKETQDTAASSSLFGSNDNNFNGYYYGQPDQNKFTLSAEKQTTSATTTVSTTAASTIASTTTPRPNAAAESSDQSDVFNGYQYLPPERTSRRLETTRLPSAITTPNSIDSNSAGRFTTQRPSSFAPRQPSTTTRPPTDRTTTEDIDIDTLPPTTKAPPLIHSTNSAQLLNRIRVDAPRTTTPFYTPTVPTVMSSRSTQKPSTTTTTSTESSVPPPAPASVSEHAIEMMKTLQELKLDTTVPPPSADGDDAEYERLRPGLVIPPSSGPDALNALAIFYATGGDNLASNKTELNKLPGLEDLDVQIGNVSKVSSAHVSNATVARYENLFGIDNEDEMRREVSEINSNLQTAPGADNDLDTEFSSNPLLTAAGTPQIRELAQVFTHALSAYLHDPQTFRRVLSEIRPTEPSVKKTTDYLVANRIGRTDDFNMGTGPTYLPTAATSSATATTVVTPTTEDLEVLEFSDVTSSTTTPTTTDQSPTTTNAYADTTTTNPPETTKISLSTAHKHILKTSLHQADRVPASRILTQALENTANTRYTNSILDATTESSNPLAMEINGGLAITTNYPYLSEEENNSTGYFPVRDRSGASDADSKKKTSYQPYGQGVKPANSTPIYDQSPNTESDEAATTTEAPLQFDLLPPSAINKGFDPPLAGEILPPVDENDLQRAQSQSIYGNGNNDLKLRAGKTAKLVEATTVRSVKGHYITQTIAPSTEAPAKLVRTTSPDTDTSHSVFLDPLTINDSLMDEVGGTITPSPNTYLPRSTTPIPTTAEVSQTESLRALAEGKVASPTTPNPTSADYIEVMQQKANEMFGGLNETSVDHLMNVMKKADKSKTVRRLILLLIQTCDDDYNTTVEQSRTALLNALIGMDGKIDEENELQIIKSHRNTNTRAGKNIATSGAFNSFVSQSTPVPITTYHRPIADILNRNSGGPSSFGVSGVTYASTTTPQYVPSTVAFTTAATTEFDDYSYRSTIAVDTTDFDTTTEILTTNPPPTTTAVPITTTRTPTTTTSTTQFTQQQQQRQLSNRNSRRTQVTNTNTNANSNDSRRVSKDLDKYLGQVGAGTLHVDAAHKHSDTRALELLRSLYSLAGRFGK